MQTSLSNRVMDEMESDEEQFKFMLDPTLRLQLDKIFADQGLNIKEGMKRLIEFLIERPKELHPLILKQLPGNSANIIAVAVLKDLIKKPHAARTTTLDDDDTGPSGFRTSRPKK